MTHREGLPHVLFLADGMLSLSTILHFYGIIVASRGLSSEGNGWGTVWGRNYAAGAQVGGIDLM